MQPGMMAGYRWERQKGRLSERAEPGVQQLPQEGFLEEAGWPKTDERIEMSEEAERNGKGDGPGTFMEGQLWGIPGCPWVVCD